jgi:hypothetical protein
MRAKQAPRLGQRARVRQALVSDLDTLREAINQNAGVVQAHDEALAKQIAVIGASFWGRLRWLVFGLRIDG